VERLDFENLNDTEVKERYQFKFSNIFAALKNLDGSDDDDDDDDDVMMIWTSANFICSATSFASALNEYHGQ
jgi:hypothetical protein